jgi:uncharacterized repeat protein (TIGR01451 family)
LARCAVRSRWAVLVALVAATALLSAGAASAAGSLTVTNVSCTSAGYSFTDSGSGFPANATLIVWVSDNLNPGLPLAQPAVVTTDASGAFTLDFAAGPGQMLPAQIEVTDLALSPLGGPQTVAPVMCTPPPVPDLLVTKTTPSTTVTVGDSITYTITVSNIGAGPADNVRLTDLLAGPATISSMGCYPVGNCALHTIAPGQSVTVTMVATTNGPGAAHTLATATTTSGETNLTNNTGTAPDVLVFQPVPPPGCETLAEVTADAHFTMIGANGKLVAAHVQVTGDCDLDKKTQTYVIHHASAKIQIDGGPPLLDATTDGVHHDVVSMSVAGDDVTITGSYQGSPFSATLHDGGGKQLDAVQIMYRTFATATGVQKDASVTVGHS